VLMAYVLLCMNCRSSDSEGGEQPALRLRLGGDIVELSYDDEISIASEDAGDEETIEQHDAGDEQSVEKGCDEGKKRKGCGDGNDVNDNVWPRSGMQAQNYHRKLSIWKKLIQGRNRYFNLQKYFGKRYANM